MIRNYLLPDPFICSHHSSTARLDPSQRTALTQLTNTRTDYNSSARGSSSDLSTTRHQTTAQHQLTALARYDADNIYESKY